MKSTKIFLLGGVTVLLAAFSWWYFQSDATEKNNSVKKSPPPVPVLASQAVLHDMPVVLNVVGRSEPYTSVTLKARVDGQVTHINFTEGQLVQAGEVLLQLDNADYSAKLRQAEANLTRSQAQLAKAKSDLQRATDLVQQGFISVEKLTESRTNEAAFAAAVQGDQAARDLAQLQLSYTTVRAPFTGVIGARLVHPGASVKTNDTALAIINRVQPLYASFSLPEKYLSQVKTRLGEGGLEVQVSVPGQAQRSQSGKLTFVDNAVDSATGTVLLKALLPNQDNTLAAGQFLNVNLILDTVKDAVTVPAEAIQQAAEGNYVYVLDAEGKAAVRKVEVLATQHGLAGIARGLVVGEMVVSDGQLRLTPGAKTVIKERSGNQAGQKK